MSSLPAKFASALVFGAVATAASTSLPLSTARADNCLLEPSADGAPQGKHWFYRTERGTGRKCWYLRDPDDKSARADTPSQVSEEKPAPRRTEAAPTRTLADAHAEIAPRPRAPETAPAPAPSIWQAARPSAPAAAPPVANAGPPPLAPRWPQAQAPAPAASPQPEASLMVADTTAPDASATKDDPAQTLPPPATLAAAPAERNIGSIQKLLLVAIGALALAGLTGSAVYRLGHRRKRNDWLRERSNWQSLENPRDPPWVDPQFAPANSNVPDLDEVKTAEPRLESSRKFESDEAGDRVEKIEDFLARLTRQLHDELDTKPAAGRDARAAS